MTVRARGTLLALLASFVSLATHAQDLLILRDGARRVGQLQTCTSESCRLGGQVIERVEISWIGLGSAQGSPPPVSQTATDEVHLVGGSVRTESVIGVSPGAVATQSGPVDRSQVRWIHFRGQKPSTSTTASKPEERRGWTGTMTSQSAQTVVAQRGGLVCSGNWTTTISFVVNDQGEIHGRATATLTGRECSHPEWSSPQVKELTSEITGTATSQQLQFQLKAAGSKPAGSIDFTGFGAAIGNMGGAPPTFTVPIRSPGDARGDVSLKHQAGPTNLYTSSNTIALQFKG